MLKCLLMRSAEFVANSVKTFLSPIYSDKLGVIYYSKRHGRQHSLQRTHLVSANIKETALRVAQAVILLGPNL